MTIYIADHYPPSQLPCLLDDLTIQAGNALATIKSLRKATPDEWEVHQHNPDRDFTLPRSSWSICHRVVGRYNRR